MKSPLFPAAGVAVAPAAAVAPTVTISIPEITGPDEYHRPYVAVWLEPANGGASRTLAVWYDIKRHHPAPGTRWLNHLRRWWRQGGRSLAMPASGVSGETRAPGAHRIVLPRDLAPGAYMLRVEAAREVGGAECVSVPITNPGPYAHARGTTELGAVTISAR